VHSAADEHGAHATGPDRYLQHHFRNIKQQTESATMGMWLFLAQEVLFFGGLFCCYFVYRYLYPQAWEIGSAQLPTTPGAINTIVLLLSSFSMAMAVYYTQIGRKKAMIGCLITTLVLGIAFVVIKWVFEYSPKIEYGLFPGAAWNPDPHHYPAIAAHATEHGYQLFFFLYFLMTGMHAFHMLIGFGILIVMIYGAFKDWYGPDRYIPIELFGLYWHFVDIVWVFLFPLWYLVGDSGGH